MFEIIERSLIAFFCGYSLCLSGSLSQLSTNNNLSSPSTLGFTGIGVLSILISFFFKKFFDIDFELEYLSLLTLTLLILGIVLFINGQKLTKVKNLILLGLGFNLFVGAIFSVVNFILISKGVSFPNSIWFGNFRYVSLEHIYIFSFLFLFSNIFVKKYTSNLELLNFGDLFCANFKIQADRLVLKSLFLSLMLTSFTVIFFGVFSFVGLVMPHILRSFSFFKYSVRNELILGPYISGVTLLSLDLICYEWPINGAELPVGMLSTIFGSLALITILLRSDKESS